MARLSGARRRLGALPGRAKAALGGTKGFVAGRVRFLRSLTAQRKLEAFVGKHPEYQ